MANKFVKMHTEDLGNVDSDSIEKHWLMLKVSNIFFFDFVQNGWIPSIIHEVLVRTIQTLRACQLRRCIQSASLRPETHSFFWTQKSIEQRVQMDAEKKSNVYANYKKHDEKNVTRYANLQFCESKFQNKGEKPLCFPQSRVLSLLCLNSHVLRDVIRVIFW